MMYRYFIILCLAALTSCLSTREHVVESDYSYRGRFNKYKTFGFMNNKHTGGLTEHNATIEKQIGRRLRSMGYQYTDHKPSLIVSYKLYHSGFQIKSYAQPVFEDWLTQTYSAKVVSDETEVDEEELDEEIAASDEEAYTPFIRDIKEGAVFISFVDRRAKQAVWQGYASGTLKDEEQDNERFLNATVGKILDEYRALANGFDFSKNIN